MEYENDNAQIELEIEHLRTERKGLVTGALVSVVIAFGLSIAETVVSMILHGTMGDILHGSLRIDDVIDWHVVGILLVVWFFYIIRSIFKFITATVRIAALKLKMRQ